MLWRRDGAARAAWRGFLFGLGQFGVGVSWLYVALHEFGNMPGPLAAFALLLFFAFLAAYPAALGWVQARAFARGRAVHAVLVLPGLWVLWEWVRGWFLTGFPWLHLGYSQIDTPLAGFAPLLGVYGVSLAAVASAGLAAEAWARRRGAWPAPVAALALLWLGGWLAGRVDWVEPDGAPLRVAIVQGNVPLAEKWYPRYRQTILNRYRELTLGLTEADLVVWPEAAVPAYRDELEAGYLADLAGIAHARGMDILLGVLEQASADGRRVYYNSALAVGGTGPAYRKHHLVPFGEYLPFKGLFGWLLATLDIPMSDFSAGPADQGPMRLAGRALGVSICYEFAFGEEIIRALPQAQVLVNISEDAWYGDSFAPHQHQQMVRMRAREAGRPLLRATNTGVSALIDHRGRVTARAPQFEVAVLTGTVQPMRGATPYVRAGNYAAIALAALGAALGLWLGRSRRA